MKVTLSKTFEFSASHRLFRPDWSDEQNFAVFGKCSNPGGHGHNYKLVVGVAGEPSLESGMIIDAGQLKKLVLDAAVNDLDHRNINHDVPWMQGLVPTVELLAQKIWMRLGEAVEKSSPKLQGVVLDSLELWETSTIVARIRVS